ncbi:hypothetical protein Vadar_026887 [Vaccinium darrowii]|uniref:Uncharacterized protein n=1 Tax=Vaccinium darrowii TaxID=229202 RepID=A0ACB7XDN1_9ERIC|nr:hypothetical protein Vadar_026887 [Vaccinium darrowii]
MPNRFSHWPTPPNKIDHRINGIDNIVTAYEIHYLAAVEKKRNGSVDWHAVLGLSSDVCPHIETVKKRYKKLALTVHPDKNGSAAAEGAFKLISEAVEAIISSPQAASRVKHKSNDSNKASTRRSSWTRKAKATPKTSTPSYSSSKSEDRLCVKCKRSPRSYNSIYCPYCVQSEPSRPVPPSSPKRAANSSNETGSTKKSNVKCPCLISLSHFTMHLLSPQALLNAAEEEFYCTNDADAVDWYAVLGFGGTFRGTETGKQQFKKLALMVHPDKISPSLQALLGAFRLISQVVKVIISSTQAASRVKPKNNDSNKTSTRPSSWTRKAKATPKTSTPSYSSSKSEYRVCIKCKRLRQSYPSIYCLYCVQSAPSRPVPPSFPKRAANSSNETASTKKPNVKSPCSWCNSSCVYQSKTEFESAIRCTKCMLGHNVPAKQGSSGITATTSNDCPEHSGFSMKSPNNVKCLWCNSQCDEFVRCTKCVFGHSVPAKQGWAPHWNR